MLWETVELFSAKIFKIIEVWQNCKQFQEKPGIVLGNVTEGTESQSPLGWKGHLQILWLNSMLSYSRLPMTVSSQVLNIYLHGLVLLGLTLHSGRMERYDYKEEELSGVRNWGRGKRDREGDNRTLYEERWSLYLWVWRQKADI